MIKNILFTLVTFCIFSNSLDLFASISTPFSHEMEAVIYDYDGVLVDMEYLKFLGWQKALASLNIELTIAEYKVVAGHSSKKIDVSFKKDEYLERDPNSSAQKCLEEFCKKGGSIQCISNLIEATAPKVQLNLGDAIYPICSGGFCRSQALWAILKPFSDQIILFPPHAARVGWDPYNGQINRFRNYAQEKVPDEFNAYFGIEKAQRFGFENNSEWEFIEHSPTSEGLNKISEFYSKNFYGPNSSWVGLKGKKRVYIAFSNNVHVALYRLNQTNDNLKDVTVIAIESEDLITYPPSFLNTTSRSTTAYEYFTNLLRQIFDLTEFESCNGCIEKD